MKKIFASARTVKEFLPPNKTFTLVAGSFDLLHVGHIHLFEFASTLEDLLVVAALSDESVRRYKPAGRPVINESQRAKMLASLAVVDMVYISDVNPNGRETLEFLRPNSVVFGGDVSAQNVGRWTSNISVSSPHTRVHILPRYDAEEVSTSHIIKRIRAMDG